MQGSEPAVCFVADSVGVASRRSMTIGPRSPFGGRNSSTFAVQAVLPAREYVQRDRSNGIYSRCLPFDECAMSVSCIMMSMF